jgi:DNA-binding Xre family transcriptional regulator
MSELEAKSDAQLAEWHSGWKPGSANHILAEREWERRQAIKLMQEQFKLDERLADVNAKAMRFATILSVCASLAGAILGAIVTYWAAK